MMLGILVWTSYLHAHTLICKYVHIHPVAYAHNAHLYSQMPQLSHKHNILGAVSIKRCRLTSIEIPMLKIRHSHDRLIFNMGISITRKDGLYIETGPWIQFATYESMVGD